MTPICCEQKRDTVRIEPWTRLRRSAARGDAVEAICAPWSLWGGRKFASLNFHGPELT